MSDEGTTVHVEVDTPEPERTEQEPDTRLDRILEHCSGLTAKHDELCNRLTTLETLIHSTRESSPTSEVPPPVVVVVEQPAEEQPTGTLADMAAATEEVSEAVTLQPEPEGKEEPGPKSNGMKKRRHFFL